MGQLLLSVFIGTHMIMLSEFSTKIAGTCKTVFFSNGKNAFLSSIKLFGSLRQSVLNQICYRRTVDVKMKNV